MGPQPATCLDVRLARIVAPFLGLGEPGAATVTRDRGPEKCSQGFGFGVDLGEAAAEVFDRQ